MCEEDGWCPLDANAVRKAALVAVLVVNSLCLALAVAGVVGCALWSLFHHARLLIDSRTVEQSKSKRQKRRLLLLRLRLYR